MDLEKNRTDACTFPVQRKEINVFKVPFTMRYSSRKLSNDKVITTACNFWRQIACSFQVMSGNILFLGKKIFEISPFFQTQPGDLGKQVHACSLRFSALNLYDGLDGQLCSVFRSSWKGRGFIWLKYIKGSLKGLKRAYRWILWKTLYFCDWFLPCGTKFQVSGF